MIDTLKNKIADFWLQWSQKRTLSGNPQCLKSKNTYIVPSAFGWTYGFFLLTLFSGAVNYQISTVFLMTFLLGIIGLISAWEAHANIKGLSIKLLSISDCQQGQTAQLVILLTAHHKKRFSVECQTSKDAYIFLDIIPQTDITVTIALDTPMRGCFLIPRVKVSSVFPFGIFRVWGYADFSEKYYVYPQSLNPNFWPIGVSETDAKAEQVLGNDDIYDLKQVENPWSNPNRIAWKIAARGQGWYLKTLDSHHNDYWLFQINDLSSINIETQLQHLCYWLQEAESNHNVYALEVSGTKTIFANGKHHLQKCLRLLAIY